MFSSIANGIWYHCGIDVAILSKFSGWWKPEKCFINYTHRDDSLYEILPFAEEEHSTTTKVNEKSKSYKIEF